MGGLSEIAPNSEPRISAIVVAYDRRALVGACIRSLLAQSLQAVEIVVVLNGAVSSVEKDVLRHAGLDGRVRPLNIARASASVARNAGVAAARAPLLYFLDDDVEVPAHGLEAAVALFESRSDIAIAGGPNLTPPDDPEFGQMTGELLASAFGTGITHFRYARGPERPASEKHLTLCNLAVKKSVFESGLQFPASFGGEENVLMGNASHFGHGLWYSPELWVHHRRRSDLAAYAAQVHRYGFGRGIAICTAKGTFHVAYFVPVCFTAYLFLAVPAALFAGPFALVPALVYLVLATLASVRIAFRRHRPSWMLRLPWLFATTHVAYAFGLVKGLLRGIRQGQPSPESQRSTPVGGRVHP